MLYKKKNTIIYRLMTFSLILSLLIGSGGVPARAKKRPSLSSKKLTVKVGKTVTLKLKNNKKKVTWRVISGKGKIKLTSQGKNSVRIKGKKQGNAVVAAKVGKTAYTCRITIKKKTSNNSSTVNSTSTPKPEGTSSPKPGNSGTVSPGKPSSPASGSASTVPPGTTNSPASGSASTVSPGGTSSPASGAASTLAPGSTNSPGDDSQHDGNGDDTGNEDSDPSATGLTLTLGTISVSLGESLSSLQQKLGAPLHVDKMPQGFDGYVYNPREDYTSYMILGVKNNKVVTCFTLAKNFSVENYVQEGESSSTLDSASWSKITDTEYRTLSTSDGNIMAFCDIHGTGQVYGILLYTSAYTSNRFIYGTSNVYSADMLTAAERQVFEITNAFRVYHGVGILQRDSRGDTAARMHSQDMADNNYFNHISQGTGYTFGIRLKNAGIIYTSAGENIIAGYADGISMMMGWINSQGHRTNMLNANYKYIGCGAAYGANSTYKIYATQDFWK